MNTQQAVSAHTPRTLETMSKTSTLRQVGRLAAEALAAGLIASLVLVLAVFIAVTRAEAATPTGDRPGTGTLLLRTSADEAGVAAPLLSTEVEIDVAGMTARSVVTQRFENPTKDWQEAVYVFPLPESAAVDHLEMKIGQRRISGEIHERAKARAAYEQAKQEGRKTTLLEQERPNMFTTSVANIGPGERIEVTIEYQETLRYDNGSYRLRFPMAITPRYLPAALAHAEDESALAQTLDDAIRITPPTAHPDSAWVHPVTIMVTLDAGFPIGEIASPYHDVEVAEASDHVYHVMLADGAVVADRDFELTWTPDVGHAPGAALFSEQRDGRAYLMAMVLPPVAAAAQARLPRETVFIVDTSGSMEGTSIAQARSALLMALDRLAVGDRFNVIEFNSNTHTLFDAPVPVDVSTLAQARKFVSGLRARGGTEMRGALEAALTREAAPGYVRQVIFLTDGAVGNEAELLALITQKLGDRRLFTIGIGSAPNSYFMTKAAQFGRGTFTYIGDVREVGEKMGALFRKLESPVLTDLAIEWPGRAESFPSRIPDLYAGEPIVVTAALDKLEGEVKIRGRRGGQPWEARLPIDTTALDTGVGVLFARSKIEALSDAMAGGAPEDEVRPLIVDVALAHHLVSRYTSLVAVDTTPTAPVGAAQKVALPSHLPNGMSYEAVFGGLPQTATPAELQLWIGLLALLLALLAWAAARRTGERA